MTAIPVLDPVCQLQLKAKPAAMKFSQSATALSLASAAAATTFEHEGVKPCKPKLNSEKLQADITTEG